VKALVLAGGFGTRLRPLTYTRPKHLLPIANRPHIEHVFDLLLAHGIREVVLLTSYLADAFTGAIATARERGLEVSVAYEQAPLGTAGALKNAQELVGDGTFLAFNGDILTDLDLDAVLNFHRGRGAEATIVLTPVDDPSAFGVVPTAADGRVLGFIEKPPPGQAPTNLINAGVYVFEPQVLERIPAGQVYSAERELFPGMVAQGARLFALPTDAYWIDIGTPEKFLQANLDAVEGRYRTSAVARPGPGMVLADAGAQIAPGARVSSACLGADSSIGPGAVVERSVLLPGAQVGAGAVVRGSSLGEGALVEAGVLVENRAVGDHETVAVPSEARRV
jgi:mannose-1-phosphate guanylyltransferase